MEQSGPITLPATLLQQAQLFASQEHLTLEQVLHWAMENGLEALRSEQFFRSRKGRGNIDGARNILARAGAGTPPVEGDTLPEDFR